MAGGICQIVNVTSEVVYCLTPGYPSSERLVAWNSEVGSELKGQMTAIQLRMDEYRSVPGGEVRFEYVSDPKIVEIGPERAIVSGGLVVSVKGSDFENVQAASLVLTEVDVRAEEGECDVRGL